jgi:tetratricopeptide (TPR) repeat protein
VGQCPPKDSLWKRLIFLRDSSDISSAEQIKELQKYELSLDNCPYRNDSVHALLLQRIGVLHFYQADYINALAYIRKSINLIASNSTNRNVSIRQIVRNYYNLAAIYNALNRVSEKISAVDSCVAIAIRINSVDKYPLYALKEKVEYLFDIGDYQRAFGSAEMGESIIKYHLHGKDSIEYVLNFSTWTGLESVPNVTGSVEFSDTSAAQRPQGFYRAIKSE